MRKNDSGFGVIGVLIVVMVIVIVGLVGWRVMASQDNKNSNASDTATFPESSASKNDTTGDSQKTTTSGKYLEIKEWGVKFSLTTKTADAYYDSKTTSSLDSMSLRSHSLDSEPKCKSDPQSVATIFRVAKDATDPSTGKKYNVTQGGQTIGNYFYFIQSAQSYCTDNTELQTTLQGILIAFNVAGPSIQKI